MQQNLYAVAGYRNGILHAFHKLFAKRAVFKSAALRYWGRIRFCILRKNRACLCRSFTFKRSYNVRKRLQGPCYSKRYFQGHEQYDFQKSIRGRHKLLWKPGILRQISKSHRNTHKRLFHSLQLQLCKCGCGNNIIFLRHRACGGDRRFLFDFSSSVAVCFCGWAYQK